MIPVRQLLVHNNGHEHEYCEQKEQRVVGAGVYAQPGGYENVKNVYVEVDRPNIFALYEQNIGLLTPLIAEDLKDAINHYPEEWIEAAF